MGEYTTIHRYVPGDAIQLTMAIQHNVYVVEVHLFFANSSPAGTEIRLDGTPQLKEDQRNHRMVQALRSEVTFLYRVPADIEAGEYHLKRAVAKTFAGASYLYEDEELENISNFIIKIVEEPEEKPRLGSIYLPKQ